MKRTFLIPVAAALTALVTPAQAVVQAQQATPATTSNVPGALSRIVSGAHENFYQKGTDLFSFILGKSATGELIAEHASHASHKSHASHSSHYSGR
jgi:hypothetical protein